MIGGRRTEVATGDTRSLHRVGHLAAMAFFGVLPVAVVVMTFVGAIGDHSAAFDFQPFYRAAEDILHGRSPYPSDGALLTATGHPYVYPPLPALVAVPLTLVPLQVAEVVAMASCLAAALAIPYVLGVRDWRCFGAMLLWAPMISAIQTANLTIWLGLAAAIAWRYRDRALPTATAVGTTLAAKFFFWPLVAWLGAARRYAAAGLSVVIGAVVLLVSWAAIGFDGLTGYPDLLRRLEQAVGHDSYTLYMLGIDVGLPHELARALWLAAGLALLTAVVVMGRRGDERRAFVLAIAAALALTPLVWLHYFALLVVVVALAEPTLGVLWLLPLAFLVAPANGHPSGFEVAAALAIAALVVGRALQVTPDRIVSRSEDGESARPYAQALSDQAA